MTIGRRADSNDEAIERASRILARALGYGTPWYATTIDRPYVEASDNDPQTHALALCMLGPVTEQAAWSLDGSRHARRQRMWRYSTFRVAVPVYTPDRDALAALAMARLDGPLGATLLLYATSDVEAYWPVVLRYGMACVSHAFASEAVTDAMQRILCGRAAISMDDRARLLGVRASGYRGLTRSAEARFRRWLGTAANRYLAALGSPVAIDA